MQHSLGLENMTFHIVNHKLKKNKGSVPSEYGPRSK